MGWNGNNGEMLRNILIAAVATIFGVGVAMAVASLTLVPRVEENIVPRVTRLETEASKGQRWTLEMQMKYMEQQSTIHQQLAADIARMEAQIRAICKATGADC